MAQKPGEPGSQFVTKPLQPHLPTPQTLESGAQLTLESYTGLLPPPQILEKFDQLIPNGAERLMRLVENQQDHRIRMEAIVIPSQQRQSAKGQYIAFIVVLLLIGAGMYAISLKEEFVAGIIFSATILGIAGLFITGKLQLKRDLRGKEQAHSPPQS